MKYRLPHTAAWLCLFVSSLFTHSGSAALVTVTFEGTRSFYQDTTGLLPFAEPADNSLFRATAVYDSNATLSPPTPIPGAPAGIAYPHQMELISLTVAFGGMTFSQPTGSTMSVANDSALSPGYMDYWRLHAAAPHHTLTNASIEFGVYFSAYFEEAPGGPMDGLTTDVPSLSGWYPANIFFAAYEYSQLTSSDPKLLIDVSRVEADITSVSVDVTPVPLPASGWLLMAALTGLTTLGGRAPRWR